MIDRTHALQRFSFRFPSDVRRLVAPAVIILGLVLPLKVSGDENVPCGGPFPFFVDGLKAEALASGFDQPAVEEFFAGVVHDPDTIRRDRAQGIFRKSFIEFSKLVMAEYRIVQGAKFEKDHSSVFDRVEDVYGVQRGVLLSFLALETDFGLVQGDHNTLNSLVTLSHDCRRPGLFRPHIFAALELFRRGDFDPAGTVGAWAGEIGMIQMLPSDILEYGQDGDGDGRVDLKSSTWDALMTAGRVLHELGWEPNQPWLVEVIVPRSLDWSETGLGHEKTVAEWMDLGVRLRTDQRLDSSLTASILLPHGRFGPAFFALDNFRLYFEWNRSFVYATTSAFFATLLSGSPMYLDGSAPPPLAEDEIRRLQESLRSRGHDVGAVDGIVGSRTRSAVQAEQVRHGLPADAWPTLELLDLLS
ncbi:MAG: peptidoglycan-binding protein [Paracoccaceae bacterium]|nr:peptidoglycan-binding protein [Paracoccaceae bacterium]